MAHEPAPPPHELIAEALKGTAGRVELFEVMTRARSSRSPVLDTLLDDLALRAAGGDDAAVELLLEVVHRLGLARATITSLILDAALVDDVAQLTLMTVERRIGTFEGRSKFRTWLFTVARNTAIGELRRRHDEPVDEIPEPEGTRFSSMVASRMKIETLIDGLGEPYTETLRLQLFDNLDYATIADRLGVPIGTVRSRLAKAKVLLRSALEGA
jgi:RNA polymerase sigma-70 factor (ECF subfamily)